MARLLVAAGLIFVLDQATKVWVVHLMNLRHVGAIDVWPPYLNFRMAWNHGVNFGLFASRSEVMRWALVALALVISAWVAWWVRREGGRWMEVFGGILIGGALGNVVDRVLYGAVADFLNMSCCGITNPYAFNVADIAIFVGAAGLVLAPAGEKTA